MQGSVELGHTVQEHLDFDGALGQAAIPHPHHSVDPTEVTLQIQIQIRRPYLMRWPEAEGTEIRRSSARDRQIVS